MSYQKSCACHATTAEIIDAIVVHGRIACVLLHDTYLRIQSYFVCLLLFHCNTRGKLEESSSSITHILCVRHLRSLLSATRMANME